LTLLTTLSPCSLCNRFSFSASGVNTLVSLYPALDSRSSNDWYELVKGGEVDVLSLARPLEVGRPLVVEAGGVGLRCLRPLGRPRPGVGLGVGGAFMSSLDPDVDGAADSGSASSCFAGVLCECLTFPLPRPPVLDFPPFLPLFELFLGVTVGVGTACPLSARPAPAGSRWSPRRLLARPAVIVDPAIPPVFNVE
jgi:hypothetical protein